MSFNKGADATTLEWRAKLDIDIVPDNVRKSSIIVTIGPKTNSAEMITALRQAGANIVRMNFSHGSYDYHASVVANVRKSYADTPGRPIAIALDTKGPEIRTGNMVNDVDVPIEAGHEMVFTVDPQYSDKGTAERMYIDYTNLPKVVDIGKKIYVDDGILSFKVLEKGDDYVKVKAINAARASKRVSKRVVFVCVSARESVSSHSSRCRVSSILVQRCEFEVKSRTDVRIWNPRRMDSWS
ncbi:PK-domain-containing protein [Ramicandelaber brevisporus]|nr:PK-domain-containing protein [Ramicandelaber brevisporus]